MREVHFRDWVTDECPNAQGKHLIGACSTSSYPSGDRLQFMQCENCDAVIWGYFRIEEEPF